MWYNVYVAYIFVDHDICFMNNVKFYFTYFLFKQHYKPTLKKKERKTFSYKELFLLLQADDICHAPIGSLVDDILFVKNSCSVCHFSFVKSLCNKAVLALATRAVSSVSPQLWLEDCRLVLFPLYNLILFNNNLYRFNQKK